MEIYKFVFSPIEVNTYVLADKSGDCAIMDCGCYSKSECDKLATFIKEKGLTPVLLLNTHCHLDHVFGNSFILERYGLKTFSNEQEEVIRKDAVSHAASFGLTMKEPPEPEGFLEDEQMVTFGSTSLRVLHVPGHSPGSIAFFSAENDCVFTGDALFAGSIGRSDLKDGDHSTLLKSIREKLFTLPPETVVYAGHGYETTIGTEVNTNPFFT